MGFIEYNRSELYKSARYWTGDHEKARHMVENIHALAHNLWANLEGNTAETDVEWFARVLYEEDDFPECRIRWDNAPEVVRRHWLETSRRTIDNLPRLMSRMANRAKHMADAAKLAMDFERAAEKGEKGE